jgi:hypothetical protein
VLFLKRQWPIIVAFVMGIVMWARYYIPTAESVGLLDLFTGWVRIIIGFAAILAVLSLLHHHWNKIKHKRPGFGFSYITLVAFVIMAVFGLLPADWHWLGFAANLQDLDGPHMYMFEYMLVPMQATMFSVLAFFIASAAFRAFRARSVEATALLIAGCVLMIGRVPVGDWLAVQTAVEAPVLGKISLLHFPYITDWLLNIPNAAAQRGIILGVLLSWVAISVRIIFGIERTYMGGGD